MRIHYSTFAGRIDAPPTSNPALTNDLTYDVAVIGGDLPARQHLPNRLALGATRNRQHRI
ncbi:hypothetical protein [Mycobacteroides abscessus]|uniref:Uncharacterized protein n=1 Tax=Mycobacteroides abscessus subsp. massiliense TaxID=1962118 RepID=A0A1T6U8N5_9MYCO|nr:hypothetical protein [Mycobacteroides abscessus]EIU05551.1 hypothetical protein MA5S0421_4529 [Mycobacteroides abscessus 5S-0421]EIU11982.1 hypothetical protein MA5S0304_4294 [Mycobacteroides abscessus 5S-0304]EIU22831.1 hypothetical protein MA5S0708_4222 [Mycobacteroides abscessus 5S-0708]EIU28999.1 hypothetical protein MA5S1212_3979 [Mycobacteroides abscessus 5S-1212]EIU42068.1 hypothetical protein MA5S1215_4248 [Mycobacteroides abscessus 5S-1215]EIV66005.1 hypothetical protein MMCCUG488